MTPPTVLDLFSGVGGWALGMERAGFQTVAACDIDPWRREMYNRNFPTVKMYDDVCKLTAARLRRDLGFLPDVIVGSPPCQSFSVASHYGSKPNVDLFLEFVRLVREIRPVVAAAENVIGLRTRGADRVLGELEGAGYACGAFVAGARHAGSPHRRDRVWIIAADADRTPGTVRKSKRRDARPEQPAAERGAAGAWAGFEAGLGRHSRTYDGVPDRLAVACADAFGDAVVPALATAIGRSILRLMRL